MTGIPDDFIVGQSRDDLDCFFKLSRLVGYEPGVAWLNSGLTPSEEWEDTFEVRFGDLKTHLDAIVNTGQLSHLIDAGKISDDDISRLAGTLSHCHQRHIRKSEVLGGRIGDPDEGR